LLIFFQATIHNIENVFLMFLHILTHISPDLLSLGIAEANIG